jgi:hypothetical protein
MFLLPTRSRKLSSQIPQSVTLDTNHPRYFLPLSSLIRYAPRMTTISKILLTALALSVVAPAQSAPKKSPAKSPNAAATPSASENRKNQNDAAAKASGSHANNMVGNHKDMMMATAPSSSGKTQQSGTTSAASPAAQPTAPANKSTASDPNSPH